MVSEYMKKQYLEVMDREIQGICELSDFSEVETSYNRLVSSLNRRFDKEGSNEDISFLIDLTRTSMELYRAGLYMCGLEYVAEAVSR